MSGAFAAIGGIVKVGASATPTAVLDGIKELKPGGGERGTIDTTVVGSTVTEKFIPKPLRAVRTLDFTLLYDPADTQHERIRAAAEAATLEYITVIMPDAGAAQWAYSGYYMNWTPPTLNTDGALEVTFSFMATGAEVFTA